MRRERDQAEKKVTKLETKLIKLKTAAIPTTQVDLSKNNKGRIKALEEELEQLSEES